jgi:hypothetical protein
VFYRARTATLIVLIIAAVLTVTAGPGGAYAFRSMPCPGDLDGDWDVDLTDLSILLGNYGATSGAEYEDGDMDSDGGVDLADLAALLAVYGTTCPAPGDDCDSPVVVNIVDYPAYADYNTTCGRGNDYQDTCLEYYDGGEDIIYELNVSIPADAAIYLDPMGTAWTGVALSETCPPGETCIASSTSDSGYVHGIEYVHLDVGTYYVMIDTWPSPECIPEFTLSIEEVFVEWLQCPDGANLEGEPCGDDTNGGCGMMSPQFEPIGCGETVCGTIWADDGDHDTDWYEVVTSEPLVLTWEVMAEFDVIIGLVATDPPGSGDCWDMIGLDPWATAGIFPEVATITTDVLPPGTYWLWVSHQDFYDLPCDHMNDYVATLTCEVPAP